MEAADRDMAVVIFRTYLCRIGKVSEQVGHQHRWYLKAESRFDAPIRTAPGVLDALGERVTSAGGS